MILTQAQVDERKAVLRRFRELLEAQRAKFREYLDVLEKQGRVIADENTEAIFAHTELEQHIVGSIVTLQKAIQPIEAMYHAIIAPSGGLKADAIAGDNDASSPPIPALQTDLENLQKQVLERNEKNRELLKTRLTQIKHQLNTFYNPYHSKSVYAASAEQTASLVQIDA
ncbi:MAG: hypothetical protein Pg6C_15260 [Treponemataceae bacterium]|nr:MAG: hypothetical protein Pg6C_15260 [Treponemataceae bacterium]